MAQPFEVGEHRYPRLGLHPRHQRLAAARHDHVQRPVQARQHHSDRLTVGVRHDGNRIGRQASFSQPGLDGRPDRPA